MDFERFTTNGPAATDETDGGLCQDMLTTTVNTGQAIPEICGENSGQHSKATNLIKKHSKKSSYNFLFQFIWTWEGDPPIVQL